MGYKLKFEEEVYSEIEPIPLAAQYRLDNVGVKFGPETWNNLSNEAKLLFCHLSLKTAKEKEYYRNYVLYLLKRKRRRVSLLNADEVNREKAQWENLMRIPERVYQMVVNLDYTLSPRDWLRMSDFKRYVLVKLSQGIHSANYLDNALAELLGAESKISMWKSKSPNYSNAVNQLIS